MPFLKSQLITIGESLVAQLLACLNTRPSAGLLVNPKVHLWTAISGQLTPQSTVAQFTEASFPGYAAVNQPALLGPILLVGGEGYGMHVEADFLCSTTSPPGQVILGYWVDGGFVLYAVERFAQPVTVANLGDFISLDIIYGFDDPVTVT